MKYETIDHIRFNDSADGVIILDQTCLPGTERYVCLTALEEMAEAIRSLQVRGAPAIGIFAAFSLAALAKRDPADSAAGILSRLRGAGEVLVSTRPTAVNLSWSVRRMMGAAGACEGRTAEELRDRLYREAMTILQEDIAAGPIATSKYGTALGPILLAAEQGMHLRVFADETRPLLQGARLTSWELQRAGVDVTLICDNMAASVMKQGWIQACFVGCDRIAANGDTANKIGTSGVAILARHYGIPFYVLGPSSSVDLSLATGADIPIELRPEEEIRSRWYAEDMAPASVPCYNPAFDVTDHDLITGIITENGICTPPFAQNLPDFVKK